MRILVIPERLRQSAQALRQAGAVWQNEGARLGAAYNGLDLEVRSALNMDAQVEHAKRLADSLAQRAMELAASMENAAERFEQADRQGVETMDVNVGFALRSWLDDSRAQHPWLTLATGLSPWQRLMQALHLPLSDLTRLPQSGEGALAGLAVFLSFSWLGGSKQPFVESVWDWLQGHVWGANERPVIPQGSPASRVQTPKAREAERRTANVGSPTNPDSSASGNEKPFESSESIHLTHGIRPENFDPKKGCVEYARQRRKPDLGPTGGKGGAADYITNPRLKDKVFQIKDDTSLLGKIKRGYAIVWPRHHPELKGTIGDEYGHVAVVEKVEADYVIVSQAGWPGKPRMKIARERLKSLYIIGF